MISENFTRYYPDKEDDNFKKIVKKTLGSICDYYNFIRENYDESLKSLCEIRRFNFFYKFFLDYLNYKSL